MENDSVPPSRPTAILRCSLPSFSSPFPLLVCPPVASRIKEPAHSPTDRWPLHWPHMDAASGRHFSSFFMFCFLSSRPFSWSFFLAFPSLQLHLTAPYSSVAFILASFLPTQPRLPQLSCMVSSHTHAHTHTSRACPAITVFCPSLHLYCGTLASHRRSSWSTLSSR
jgi:hypothetical protein